MREELIAALSSHMPGVLRWAGAIARELRRHDVSISGKQSGSANTDALTLADLTVQVLLVSALRDADPILRTCRIEAEEKTGDLGRFATHGDYTIALDPIDGTKQYRDKSGDGYAVMLHLRDRETVHYSLVFIPARGPQGTWVEARGERLVCGEDDPNRTAEAVLQSFPAVRAGDLTASKRYYLIGFQERDAEAARQVTAAGLEGVTPEAMPGSIFELMARGEFAGSLIHTPNVYDFPVSLHIARLLGGDAVWVHDGRPVDFSESWLDERADMLRLPGIVACSVERGHLPILCDLARDWDRKRYSD